MVVTPLPGWKVDPNNPNGVIQDIPASGAGVKSSPTTYDQTPEQRAAAYRDAGIKDPGPSGITSDNGTARADELALSTAIRDKVMAPAPDLSYIDNYMAGLAKRREETEAAINSSFDSSKTSLGEQQKKETGSTSAALARAGGYLGFSGSGSGVLQNLAEAHKADMQSLEAKRQQALAEARNAYEDKNFAAARERINEVKDFEKQSFERQQNYFNEIKTANDKIKAKNAEEAANIDIYNAIAEGAKTETEIFGKLQGKVTPQQISDFFTKLKPKTAASATYKFTNDDVGKLLKSGLSPDEMQLFSDDLNKYGYHKAVEGLTGSQRSIVDEILGGKKTGGITNGLTISEAKALGLPPALIGMDQKQFIADLLSPKAPEWFIHYTEQTYQQNLLPEKTQELWDAFKTKVIQKFQSGSALDFNSISSDTSVSFDKVPGAAPATTDGEEAP